MTLLDVTCIQARLTLRTKAEGGRQTGIKTGYRPNHVFEYNLEGNFLNTYIGEVEFEADKTILPGETSIVSVCFLKQPDLEKYLHIGRLWYFHEGSKLIGHAEIIAI